MVTSSPDGYDIDLRGEVRRLDGPSYTYCTLLRGIALSNAVKITRKALYQRVWSEAVTRLSKEYGLSDVGFAKLCKRNDIRQEEEAARIAAEKQAEEAKRAEEQEKIRAAKRAEERKRAEAQEKIRAAKWAAILAERAKVKKLRQDATDWRESRQCRAYIAAVRQDAVTRGLDVGDESEKGKWLQWATKQADRLDPFKESPPSILDDADKFKPPE